MPYKKGQSGNLAGRPKGLQNTRTKESLTRALELIKRMETHKKFKTMLDSLTEREFAHLYRDLMEFVQPKMQRQEHTDNDGGPLVITVRHSAQPAPIRLNNDQYKIIDNE